MAHQHDINTNFAHILLNVLVQIFTSHLREALSLWMDYVFALSHFLTLSLWDTKKELSQICHLFSRVLLTFFIFIIIIIIIIIIVTIINLIIITTAEFSQPLFSSQLFEKFCVTVIRLFRAEAYLNFPTLSWQTLNDFWQLTHIDICCKCRIQLSRFKMPCYNWQPSIQ